MTQIYTELTGSEFNARQNHAKTEVNTETKAGTNAIYYKFLNDNLKHRNIEYKLGLNTDIIPFKPFGRYYEGGLNFCEESYCHLYWWRGHGKKLGIIEIPHDAKVYVEEFKFKADKIIITKIINFEYVEDRFWINILPYDGDVLRYVKNQTEEMCIAAVKKDWRTLQHVVNQTDKICTLAVQQCWRALQYVKNQTEELCIAVVKKDWIALRLVVNQTDKICIAAIQQSCGALEHVINQTDEMCILAVEQNGYMVRHVHNQTEEICIAAVKQYGFAIEYVKEQTDKICQCAVDRHGLAYKLCKKPVNLDGMTFL